MTTTEIMTQLQNLGIELQVIGDRLRFKPLEKVTDEMRSEMARQKMEIIGLLTAQPVAPLHVDEVCPQCHSSLFVAEYQTRFEIHCTIDPTHYSEHRKKPGCDRLWEDVPLPNGMEEQRTLHYALEGRDILGLSKEGLCEVGCGNTVQFFYLEGVGYGYCAKCRVDQTIGGGD
jgi:hypothetical protein